MSDFCASCISRPSTHVDEEGYRLCDECDFAPVKSYDSTRGYEPPGERMSQEEMRAVMQSKLDRLAPAGEILARTSILGRARTPSYVVIRLSRRWQGKTRDVREAFEAELADKPWAREVRHVVTTPRWHVFERPGPKSTVPSVNPIMWLERYRT